MTQPVSHLTQSRFYSPAFNAAIFDGPVRIYFAQHQESLALKVYFRLRERMQRLFPDMEERYKSAGQNVFVMLYPTQETFDLSFEPEADAGLIAKAEINGDTVLGVRGPLEDAGYEPVYSEFESIVKTLTWSNPVPGESIL